MKPIIPFKISYGAGLTDLNNLPNVVRLIIGEKFSSFSTDTVFIVETNLDDVNGEILGYLINRLFEEGARDVQFIPTFGKKNRPGILVKIIVDDSKISNVINCLFSETGTFGIRFYPCNRFLLNRDTKNIRFKYDNQTFNVRLKIGSDNLGNIFSAKLEYEDLAKIAKTLNIPLQKIYRVLLKELESHKDNT